jgi:hypothetical protein
VPELIAAIRPDDWNFPLLLHVLGAMVLVGTVGAVAIAELSSSRRSEPALMRRVSFWSLLVVGIPAYIVMRVGAEWMYSKEFGDVAEDPTWIGIGYITADAGAILLLISVILAGLASRRQSSRLATATGVVMVVLLVAWLVAVWAMGGKPE